MVSMVSRGFWSALSETSTGLLQLRSHAALTSRASVSATRWMWSLSSPIGSTYRVQNCCTVTPSSHKPCASQADLLDARLEALQLWGPAEYHHLLKEELTGVGQVPSGQCTCSK